MADGPANHVSRAHPTRLLRGNDLMASRRLESCITPPRSTTSSRRTCQLGGDQLGTITMTSSAAPGVTREWPRLSEYVDEVSNARVWAGVHDRSSTVVGQDMGRTIGELAVKNFLKPLP